jgi:peptide/nickel transport system ATP-binding protein
MSVLSVRNLVISFKLGGVWHPAVNGVSFDVERNETLCIVGESGCGKSITALSIMGLLTEAARIEGSIGFDGQNLLKVSEKELEKLRGDKLAMIFQEPMTSLNPVLKIGLQIAEPLMFHKGMSQSAAWKQAKNLLDLVRIPDAATRLNQYPHQLSGGMRQRVMIAIGLACKPDVLIADEPTTALDVTIQAQVLALLNDIRKEQDLSIILITHDLGVVANVADRVAVMYAGDLVELADVADLFERPSHPYTQALLSSIPRADRTDLLVPIRGQVPPIHRMPIGCRFSPRCDEATNQCNAKPTLRGDKHLTRCWMRGDD